MNMYQLSQETEEGIFRQIAHLHQDLLAAGLLSELGSDFLSKLYQSLAACPESAVYVLEKEGRVLAFVACTLNTNRFYKKFLYSNGLSLCYLLPKLCKPVLLKRAFSLFHYLIKKSNTREPAAELLSIAVVEGAHRGGLGSQLINQVIDFMKEKNVDCFKVTAAQTQKSAHQFYQSHGGIAAEEIDLGTLKSNVYYFNLN